ncbi:LysR family transcriptional regulator [Vibrio nomapromontoriensis]|uniref:LysR family transcriptional regulator n=1 Tax=Vibrio nomapromontoriensis TaxID=2910246 RepID=UPI003D0D7E09
MWKANGKTFDLNLLWAFVSTFETQSVTKPAEQLDLTQSSVSNALARFQELPPMDARIYEDLRMEKVVLVIDVAPSDIQVFQSKLLSVSQSQALAVVPETLFLQYGDMFNLQSLPFPFETKAFNFYMVWPTKIARNSARIWLREFVSEQLRKT